MLKFTVRRLLAAIPVLFGLSIILFAFVHFLPGDPCRSLLGQHASVEACNRLRENLGLDLPLWQQYLDYLSKLLRLDFGSSIVNSKPFVTEFFIRFPATVELAVGAMIFAVGVGIPLGRLAARHAQTSIDAGVTVVSLLGISIPVFVLALLLVYVFAVQLGWLPSQGRLNPRAANFEPVTGFLILDTIITRQWNLTLDAIAHLILPAIALGSIPLAIIARITRASVLDVNHEDYVRTARAKGLKEKRVDSRHIMRNA